MDKDNRDLVNRLFAIATMMFEDAIVPAIGGQSPKLPDEAYVRRAQELQNTAIGISLLAQTVLVVERFSRGNRTKSRHKK